MKLLNLTLDSAAENLALDEALLEACVACELPAGGVLRIWEAPQTIVVVGRATRLDEEVNLDACRQFDVPILRRVSGGMSIVAGPGCLMYSIVDRLAQGAETNIPQIHRSVLDRVARSLQRLGVPAKCAGTSDLATIDSSGSRRKVSGNSLRLVRGAYLYHGTLLYDFDLTLIERCLHGPPRAPDYREGREHGDFVANLGIDRALLVESLADVWQARENLTEWPRERVAQLVRDRYERAEWNECR